jgi:hypothetical protein
MRIVVVAVVVCVSIGLGALLYGCNNASCPFVSKCPNDPTGTPNDLTQCQNLQNDPQCSGPYNDYLACFESNQACTSSGVTDFTVTDGICGAQYAKFTSCRYGGDGSVYGEAGAE